MQGVVQLPVHMHRSIKRGKGGLVVSAKCQVHACSGVDVNILFCEPKYFYFIWQCLCFMFWIFFKCFMCSNYTISLSYDDVIISLSSTTKPHDNTYIS